MLLWKWLRLGFNLPNYNVITVSLARTYRGIPSESYEIGGNTTLSRRLKNWGAIRTSGLRPSVHIAPRFWGLRGSGWYCPQSLRTQTVFPDTSSPDSRYYSNTLFWTIFFRSITMLLAWWWLGGIGEFPPHPSVKKIWIPHSRLRRSWGIHIFHLGIRREFANTSSPSSSHYLIVTFVTVSHTK